MSRVRRSVLEMNHSEIPVFNLNGVVAGGMHLAFKSCFYEQAITGLLHIGNGKGKVIAAGGFKIRRVKFSRADGAAVVNIDADIAGIIIPHGF